MAYCVTGIVGSMVVGKLLDKYKCYKFMINLISIVIALCITFTFIGLHYDLMHPLELTVIIFTGGPMFSVAVPTFQFVAEVTYPVSEMQAVSLINVINKLISFGMAQLSSILIKSYKSVDPVFYIWIGLAALSVIPGLLVKEDLRRLNMKNVYKSNYFEDKDLMNMPKDRRITQFARFKIIADK